MPVCVWSRTESRVACDCGPDASAANNGSTSSRFRTVTESSTMESARS
jgi:hypothetical protein